MNCENFEKYLVEGTSKDPSEFPNDKNLLMKVMEVLSQHRLVMNRMDKNFAFLKETILLLKKNNVNTNEDYLAIMETRQANFKEIFQNVIKIKTNILGLQQQETEQLKKRILEFTEKVKQFRATFLQEAPFSYDMKASVAEIDASYDILDDFYFRLEEIKAEAKRFNDLENLFELELTKYKLLTECKNDLEKLKLMWDIIALINNSYADWMTTPWKAIDVESCQIDNDSYITLISKARDIKSLKGSPVIAEKCSNMKKILNCIASLNTDAMEGRHWNSLSKDVGAKIDYTSPTFAFEDIVKVNIHKYEPQVQELAEVALKEGKIGKDLSRIESTWQKLSFEFEPFTQGGGEMKIFKAFDVIQETLDADTVKILGLLSQGKSVEFFRERLDTMRSQLNNIDNTISVWGKVQKNWKRLVNIFLYSEDIKTQLPEASKSFEQRNGQFRDIMNEVVNINSIITEACTLERKAELDEINKAIEDCEKKLNQYLEQKKKAFPRFYFVSNQTLTDILSNGNNPELIVSEYLGDLFDGMKKCNIRHTEATLAKVCKCESMVAKDGEVVPFNGDFEPKEAVEVFL